jgi:hypothetical protein
MMDTIPEAIRDLFPDVEKRMAPYMRARAARYHNLDLDDVIQEARMALVSAMTKYDFNKSHGDLAPYMREVVANTYRGNLARALSKRSCPRVPARGVDGTWELAPEMPTSLEALLEARPWSAPASGDDDECPEAMLDVAQREQMVEKFKRALFRELNERERAVLRCRLQPPAEVIAMAEAEPIGDGEVRNTHIAAHLGLDKAKIDWALYRIRNVFTELAADDRFQELFGAITAGRGWPRIHLTKGTSERPAFVERVLRHRKLNPGDIISIQEQRCSIGSRRVETHPWGAIVVVELKGVTWTAVMEGQFNARAGELTGASGARLLLRIDGYAQLAKVLAAEA